MWYPILKRTKARWFVIYLADGDASDVQSNFQTENPSKLKINERPSRRLAKISFSHLRQSSMWLFRWSVLVSLLRFLCSCWLILCRWCCGNDAIVVVVDVICISNTSVTSADTRNGGRKQQQIMKKTKRKFRFHQKRNNKKKMFPSGERSNQSNDCTNSGEQKNVCGHKVVTFSKHLFDILDTDTDQTNRITKLQHKMKCANIAILSQMVKRIHKITFYLFHRKNRIKSRQTKTRKGCRRCDDDNDNDE